MKIVWSLLGKKKGREIKFYSLENESNVDQHVECMSSALVCFQVRTHYENVSKDPNKGRLKEASFRKRT